MHREHLSLRGLALLVGGMLFGTLVGMVVLAAGVAGFSPDSRFERTACRRAAATYLQGGSPPVVRVRERALDRACGGPHSFWRREVFDPWNGTEGCETAVAHYLRAKDAGPHVADEDARRAWMADRCAAPSAPPRSLVVRHIKTCG